MISAHPVLLFLVPFIAALLCAAGGWYWRAGARRLTIGALAATAGLAVWGLARVLASGTLRAHMGGWAPPLGIEWVMDPLAAAGLALVACVALVVHAGSGPWLAGELGRQETTYHACALLLVSGLLGMILSADLFNLFVHLEVVSLSAYALTATGRHGAALAAMRYLIIGSVGASLYLLGVGFLYAATGSLNMADVGARLGLGSEPRLCLAGIAFITVGLAVKMGLFPLHGWLPNAYSKCSVPAAALMAPLVTKVCALVLLRVLFWVFSAAQVRGDQVVLLALAWAGACAVIAGGLAAVFQSDLRRLLAYSSISQMGIVALGMGLASASGFTGAVLHMANDALMKAALFLAAGTLALRYGIRDVRDLGRLRGQARWTRASMAVAGLSLVGIPPLCGFFGKWYVLSAALEAGQPVLAAAVIVGSLLSAAYVLRIIEPLYFATPPKEPVRAHDGFWAPVGACGALALAVVLFGLVSAMTVSWVVTPALPEGL